VYSGGLLFKFDGHCHRAEQSIERSSCGVSLPSDRRDRSAGRKRVRLSLSLYPFQSRESAPAASTSECFVLWERKRSSLRAICPVRALALTCTRVSYALPCGSRTLCPQPTRRCAARIESTIIRFPHRGSRLRKFYLARYRIADQRNHTGCGRLVVVPGVLCDKCRWALAHILLSASPPPPPSGVADLTPAFCLTNPTSPRTSYLAPHRIVGGRPACVRSHAGAV